MLFRAVLPVILGLSCHATFAQQFGIKEVTYAEIEAFTPSVITFDPLGVGDIDSVLSEQRVSFGERFEGQSLRPKQDHRLIWHETLADESPDSPLRLRSGFAGHNLAVDYDPHWGSLALMPLGPEPVGREGTGTLAILFDEPICFVAFRTAIDGLSRFGSGNETFLRSYPEGSLNIRFYDTEGRRISSFMRSIGPEGPIAVGYMQSGQADAQIAGIFLQNLDLGGIAIDDLRFDPVCPYKLF